MHLKKGNTSTHAKKSFCAFIVAVPSRQLTVTVTDSNVKVTKTKELLYIKHLITN